MEELPCGNWTDDYKRHLCQLVEKDEIKSFSEEHTTRHVHFTIIPTAQYIDSPEQLIEKLKLKSNISLQNMVAFDANGALKRYQSPEQIIDDFFPVRLRGYDSRKQALMKRLVRDEAIARNKSQFVAQIISGQLDIFQFTASSKQPVTASTTTNKDNNKTAATTTGKTTPRGLSEVEIASKLIQAGFLSQSQIDSLSENNQNKQNESVISMNFKDTKVIEGEREKPDFSYLLDMSIHSLTETKFESLRQQADTAAMRLKELQNQSAADLWLRDLDALEVALKSIVT